MEGGFAQFKENMSPVRIELTDEAPDIKGLCKAKWDVHVYKTQTTSYAIVTAGKGKYEITELDEPVSYCRDLGYVSIAPVITILLLVWYLAANTGHHHYPTGFVVAIAAGLLLVTGWLVSIYVMIVRGLRRWTTFGWTSVLLFAVLPMGTIWCFSYVVWIK